MRRFPPDLVRELATWNARNKAAREAYHEQFCRADGCWTRVHERLRCSQHNGRRASRKESS